MHEHLNESHCLLRFTRWLKLLSLCVKSYRLTIQLKATEQHFPVVLFIILYKVFHIFASVDKMACYNLELRMHYYSYCLWTILILPQSDFACKTGSVLYRIALSAGMF